MNEKRQLSQRFARLLAALGAWTLAGVSLLMFLGESPVIGVIFAFIGLLVLLVAATGLPKRERPYERFELLIIWLGFPLTYATFTLLVAVGLLPTDFAPWLALYILIAALIFIMMIIEARRKGEEAS